MDASCLWKASFFGLNIDETVLLCFRFEVFLPEGRFIRAVIRPTGWFHIVLNYLGPNEDEGIRGYFDGTEVALDITKYPYSYSTGPGRIVVGKLYTDSNEKYGSVQIDDLIYFNKSLTRQQIETLHTAVSSIADTNTQKN